MPGRLAGHEVLFAGAPHSLDATLSAVADTVRRPSDPPPMPKDPSDGPAPVPVMLQAAALSSDPPPVPKDPSDGPTPVPVMRQTTAVSADPPPVPKNPSDGPAPVPLLQLQSPPDAALLRLLVLPESAAPPATVPKATASTLTINAQVAAVNVVPEPNTSALFAVGALGVLGWLRWRRRFSSTTAGRIR